MAKKVYRNEVELGTGGHKEILAARKKMKTKHEDGVEELLADFEGQPIAIVIPIENKKGECTEVRTGIIGIGTIEENLRLAKALREASDSVIKLTVESVVKSGDPEAILALMDKALKLRGKK